MPIEAPYSLTDCCRFFEEPAPPARQYEALRAFFVEERPSPEVARALRLLAGRLPGAVPRLSPRSLAGVLRLAQSGPRDQPKKKPAHEQIVALRKRNYSVYEISQALKEQGTPLSATAVREVLEAEGFAPLPRRLDDERPERARPHRRGRRRCPRVRRWPRARSPPGLGGLFLFVPDLVRSTSKRWRSRARLPGSRMIPAAHALRSSLALKLWSIERKSHVMALVADEGLALFCGLNVMPKKSFLSEYSSRITPQKVVALLAAGTQRSPTRRCSTGESFNLDFHSVPYFGEHPVVESHYRRDAQPSPAQHPRLPGPGRRRPSVLLLQRRPPQGRGGRGDLPLHRVLEAPHGELPRHLVFDSKLTTYAGLERLDAMGITFITLRRRSPSLLSRSPSCRRRLAHRRTRCAQSQVPHPARLRDKGALAGRDFRQFFITDLGHDEPTILLTNDAVHRRQAHHPLRQAHADRECAVRRGALLPHRSHCPRRSASRSTSTWRSWSSPAASTASWRAACAATTMPRRARSSATSSTCRPTSPSPTRITVRFHRRAHLPIVLASGSQQTRRRPVVERRIPPPVQLAPTPIVRSIPVRGNPG